MSIVNVRYESLDAVYRVQRNAGFLLQSLKRLVEVRFLQILLNQADDTGKITGCLEPEFILFCAIFITYSADLISMDIFAVQVDEYAVLHCLFSQTYFFSASTSLPTKVTK